MNKLKRYFTIFLPGFAMFAIDEIIIGILCMCLQMTLVGWPIASVWALSTMKKHLEKEAKKHA